MYTPSSSGNDTQDLEFEQDYPRGANCPANIGLCDHGDKNEGYMKDAEFCDQFLKKDYLSWS
jgi:hypothetical protein